MIDLIHRPGTVVRVWGLADQIEVGYAVDAIDDAATAL